MDIVSKGGWETGEKFQTTELGYEFWHKSKLDFRNRKESTKFES